jgi:hypothetical protein
MVVTEASVQAHVDDGRSLRRGRNGGHDEHMIPIRPPATEVHFWTPIASLRFEVEPLTPELRIWAFVSVTDNATQDVSLRVP